MGGDGIKLVCDLQNTSIRSALQILESGSFASLAHSQRQSEIRLPKNASGPLLLLGTQPIRYFPLKQYLAERRISSEVYNQYLVQVHYSTGNGKRLIALGFENDA